MKNLVSTDGAKQEKPSEDKGLPLPVPVREAGKTKTYLRPCAGF